MTIERELGEYRNKQIHPAVSDLIFWDFRDLTPKEVVEIVRNYKKEKSKICKEKAAPEKGAAFFII
ncbi:MULTISPECIES: hypothetical protein [unclassified Bacillus (in: firmicutes)]|uniref:hypothetical protein n=1 Tax=unclassified Bacillus (in: firmicutes) TaxID=185979 RepID=UPI0008F3BAEB|nr:MULTISPECIES: hypothetical protein [unclassified Bacillus (in: firmicutes)]SFI28452.1 hypothetical protein SAMN04488574_102223 [Bacillus sp. 71mf]SFS39419.1 hypothetical protein SAMN04488145_101243 [Bacillus sp. 103mf]